MNALHDCASAPARHFARSFLQSTYGPLKSSCGPLCLGLLLAIGSLPAFGQVEDEGPMLEDDSVPVLSLEVDQSIVLVGETAQLSLFGRHPDESVVDLTAAGATTFLSPNEAILTVDSKGAVVATGPGSGLIVAQYEGHPAEVTVIVLDPADQDSDGIADELETLHGLDPNDRADAGGDLDGDGLANRDELELGTDPQVADSDGDFLSDGDEVVQGRNPSGPDPFNVRSGCMVSALNRTALVDPNGSWVLPNVPAGQGLVRIRATCIEGGRTRSGQSAFITVPPSGQVRVEDIDFETASPVPSRLALSAPTVLLTAPGETTQLSATATLPDGTTQDATAPEKGTSYRSSNPAIAEVGEAGRVTARNSGVVLISALNQGALAVLQISVVAAGDSDGDGLPDDLEIANGLDPNDPIDGLDDSDGDGLATSDELGRGLDPLDADTDDDRLADGREVRETGTNPLLFDTDGDLVSDGLELQAGSSPLDRLSVELAPILAGLALEPNAFTIVYNTILGEGSRRVAALATLIDGTRLDATGEPYGTTYTSSNLVVASFGAEPGQIFAGASGVALVSATNGTFTAGAEVRVESFSPRALSVLALPGAANELALDGNHVYAACGGADLQVVDVTDPANPVLVAGLSLPGEAFDVVVAEGVAFLAAGSGGLVTVDVAHPAAPVYLGSIKTGLPALAVAVEGDVAYVADGRELRLFAVGDPARPQALGSLQLQGRPRGVAVHGSLAYVASERGGLQIVDVSDPLNPFWTGSVPTRGNGGDAADVVVRENRAYVADGATGLGGIRVVDVSDPAAPLLIGSSADAYGITGLALDGGFLLGADFFYVNAVPVFGIATDTPVLAAALDFSREPSFRGDNGKGVATRNGLVYMVGDRDNMYRYALTGRSALHIGQVLRLEEVDGTPRPPTAKLIAPLPGSSIRERRSLRITAQATDDLGVALVRFKINGSVEATDFASPFTFAYEVPNGVDDLELVAEAEDFTGSRGSSEPIHVSVIPDTDPVIALLLPSGTLPIPGGSSVQIALRATDDQAISQVEVFVDGASYATFDRKPYVTGLWVDPFISSFTVTALATDDVGQTAALEPATFTVDSDEPPRVHVLQPSDGAVVAAGGVLRFSVGASDDVELTELRYLVNGEVYATASTPPFEIVFRADPAATEIRLAAVAVDSRGQEATSAEVVLAVAPDPGTTAGGRVVGFSGAPVAGAAITCLGRQGTSGADGRFTIPGLPTIQAQVSCQARGIQEGQEVAGDSLAQPVEPGGVTEMGDIVLSSSLLYLAEGDFESTVRGRVHLLDPASPKMLPVLEDGGSGHGITGIAFDHRGRLWVTTVEETPGSFSPSTSPGELAPRDVFDGQGRTSLAAFDPDTGEVLELGELGYFQELAADRSSGGVAPRVSPTLTVHDLAFDPVSETLFGVIGRDSLEIVAIEDYAVRSVASGFEGDSVGLAAGSDGRLYLALTSAGAGSLVPVDPGTGESGPAVSFAAPSAVQGMSLAPGGRSFRLVAGSEVYDLDPATGAVTLLATPSGLLEGHLQALAYRPAAVTPMSTTLVAQVTDPSGAPVLGVRVHYPGGSLETDANGSFSAAGVVVKTQSLRLAVDDFPDLVFSPATTVAPGGVTDFGTVELEARACVEATLLAGPACIADGSPLALEVRSSSGRWTLVGTIHPGADGRFCANLKQWDGYRVEGGAVCAEDPAWPCGAYLQLDSMDEVFGRCASPEHLCQDSGLLELSCEIPSEGGGG